MIIIEDPIVTVKVRTDNVTDSSKGQNVGIKHGHIT
jgi:hypothetical protein